MDNLPAIAYIKDDKGKMWFVNKYMREKTGIGDSIGQTVGELLPAELARTIEEEDRRIREEGITVTTETRVDKQRFGQPFNTIKFPINLKGKTSWIGGIGIDISEQKEAEKELRESEEKYRLIFENSLDGISIIDTNGTIIDVNKSSLYRYGYKRSEMVGKNVLDFDTYVDPEFAESILQNIVKEKYITCETLAKRRDGSPYHMELSVNLVNLGDKKVIMSKSRDITKRKKAEKELRESEEKEKFRQIFNSTKDGMFIHCLDDNEKLGNFIEVNDVACEWTGYSRDELLQMTPYDLDKKGFFKAHKKVGKAFRQTGKIIFESKLTNKVGDSRTVEFNSHNFILKGEKIILTVARDLSKQKSAEASLKESEEKFRHIFQYANDAIYLYPISKNHEPGIFIEVNDYATTMLGYSKEELKKMSPRNIAAPQVISRIPSIVKGIIKKGPQIFEADHKTKDGRIIPVEISAHIFDFKGEQVMLSIVRDISERKRREEELQKSYNLYRILFETTGTANLLFDEEGTIILFNSRMESISGYKKEDVEGKRKWLEFIPRPELDMMVDFNEIRKEDPSKVPVQYESRFIDRDGRIRDIILTVKSIPGTTNFLASLIDITERKKIEDEIGKQKEELSDFAHFMGHDIRNSLTAIEGYVDQLKEKYEDLYFEKILRRTNYVGNLLEHSIELAEAGTTVEKKDKVNLDRLVETVADVIIPKRIKFNKDNLGTIKGDNGKLSQVFKNLFENAILHGKPNKVSVTKLEKKEEIIISISNDGKLIDENIIEKVFDRGYSTKKGSTGLGLSIAKKIIEGHGWEISIDSEEKRTNFRIIIPKK
jgi:PAS domain S-box-containing protein